MIRRVVLPPTWLLLLFAFVAAARAEQPAAFLQPRIPEDVRRFESSYRAGVWKVPPKELTELESRVRGALGLPEAAAGAPTSTADAAAWDTTQFKSAMQRESQHFAAKLMSLSVQRTTLHKEVKEFYLNEEKSCTGEKPEKCLEDATRKACVRVEDGYQRLHNEWRNVLIDFYQGKLEILAENDEKLGATNPAPAARTLAREWMQKSYQEMAARFIGAWGATLERQWGDYCTVPPPSDTVTSGWEAALRSPFPALK